MPQREKPIIDPREHMVSENPTRGRKNVRESTAPQDLHAKGKIQRGKIAERLTKTILESGLSAASRIALVGATIGIIGAVGERAGFAQEYNSESSPSASVERQESRQRDIEVGGTHEKQKKKFELLLDNPPAVMAMIEEQGMTLKGDSIVTRGTADVKFDQEINGVTSHKIMLGVADEKTLMLKCYNSDGTVDTVRFQDGDIVSAVTTRE